jgi:hypothetical protein
MSVSFVMKGSFGHCKRVSQQRFGFILASIADVHSHSETQVD